MSKVEQKGPFFKLDEKRQEAVKLLFEDDLTDVEIAKNVQRSRSTLITGRMIHYLKLRKNNMPEWLLKIIKMML